MPVNTGGTIVPADYDAVFFIGNLVCFLLSVIAVNWPASETKLTELYAEYARLQDRTEN
jgi:hypothetical protein